MAEFYHVAPDLDAKCRKELFRDRSASDSGGGLAGRGTFENVAEVSGLIFLPTREISVARTRTRYNTSDFLAESNEFQTTLRLPNG